MTMVGLPMTLFQITGGRELSDIEYLAIKEFDLKRVDVDGNITVVNDATETDIATQTASGGKDMYLGKASFQAYVSASNGGFTGTYRLYINAVRVETIILDFVQVTSTFPQSFDLEFITLGKKVTTGQIIKVTYQSSSGSTKTVQSTSKLILWEEDSGTTPEIS